MRSSDWSSEGCSSDLIRGRTNDESGGRGIAQSRGEGRNRGVRREFCCGAVYLQRHFVTFSSGRSWSGSDQSQWNLFSSNEASCGSICVRLPPLPEGEPPITFPLHLGLGRCPD